MDSKKIGFIGLGIMGKPMALNLLNVGYQLNILQNSQAADVLIAAGAKAFSNAKMLASESEVVITMLPDSPQVEHIVLGTNNSVLEGLKAGSVFIDMSTISPSTARKLYSECQLRGVSALDAPVSGGQIGAENATLSIMVGGDESTFNQVVPIFNALGQNIVLIGTAGAGQMTKACNQMIVGMTIQAVAEAFTLASNAGVDLAKMRDVLLGGFAQSKILELHGKRMIDQNFVPGFKIKLHNKDMNIALSEAKQYDLNLGGTTYVAKQMSKAVDSGNGELDHSSLLLLVNNSD